MLPLPLRHRVPELLVVGLQPQAFLQQPQAPIPTACPGFQGPQSQQGLQVLGISLQG